MGYCWMKKISAVVVLYNPLEFVLENINSYIDEVDILYVIDNSEKSNDELVSKLKLLRKVEYISKSINLGIAEALNIAAKKAIEMNYDFLLTMDQDSKFIDGGCKRLITYIQHHTMSDIGLISALQNSYLIGRKQEQLIDEPFTVITSGNLISLKAYQKTKGFNEDYFIDCVDWDYCIELRKYGYKIKRLKNAVLEHNLGEMSIHKNLFGKNIYTYNHNKVRRYYIMRNRLDIMIKNIIRYPRFSLSVFKTLLVDLKNILLYEKNKQAKLYYSYQGIVDFILRRFGKKND